MEFHSFRQPPTHLKRRGLVMCGAILLFGCPSAEPDPGDLPDETPALLDDDDDATGPMDDDDSIDEVPENVLTVSETGLLTRSPAGGPYTTITGTLTIAELLNGEVVEPGDDDDDDGPPPTCEVLFAVVGTRATGDDVCPTCDTTWQLTFSVDEGNPADCQGPEQPGDGALRMMGFVQSEQALYWNYQDLGSWVWWYHANDAGDDIAISWQTTLGIEVDDD